MYSTPRSPPDILARARQKFFKRNEVPSRKSIHIGCAGWALSTVLSAEFPNEGTHLLRYGSRFNAVEISSSFYRAHRRETYIRWASSVPENFRFSVKVSKEITHTFRLKSPEAMLEKYLDEVEGLGNRLATLLVQLPPSLEFDEGIATNFFSELRSRFSAGVVCEPRHPSWFSPRAECLLLDFKISRVAADPAPVQGATIPGGWKGIIYYRLHNSPTMYHSPYSHSNLKEISRYLREAQEQGAQTWCIFDNSAAGGAVPNALDLHSFLEA